MLSDTLTGFLVRVGTIGGAVALNLIIVGLIVIAVAHDGTTASQVAQTFQTALTAAIGIVGTLVGGIAGGKIAHIAYLAKAQEQKAP